MRMLRSTLATLAFCLLLPSGTLSADRARLEVFLEVTGFDVSLDSIRFSASAAPEMLGLEADDFGSEWTRLTSKVFNTADMHQMAFDILSKTLSDDLLSHAIEFYATDLGRRLVLTENASHMDEQDALRSESGRAILAGLERLNSPRLDYLRRMNAAADSSGTALRAIQEVQVRFLMAAANAGVINLQLEEQDLRALLSADEDAVRADMDHSALIGAAYTYQAYSDVEVLSYARALEHPKMRQVYDLMNAVQYEIMANRFEALALAMQNLQPSQDL